MKMLKMCLNPKVLAGLVVAGVGIYSCCWRPARCRCCS